MNDLWMTFKNYLSTTVEKNIAIFMLKRPSSLPWLNAQLRKLLKRKRILLQRSRASRDWSPYRNNTTQEGPETHDTKPF